MTQIKIEITLDQVKQLMDMFVPDYYGNGNVYFQDFPDGVFITQETEIHDAISDRVVIGKIPFYRFFLVFEKE